MGSFSKIEEKIQAMKKVIKSFTLIINYKTFIVTGLSVLSSYLCFTFGLTAKFPDMLVGVAIVFPVVFSIGSAYTRRETGPDIGTANRMLVVGLKGFG